MAFNKLTKPERKIADKCCFHRRGWHNKKNSRRTRAKHYGWLKYYKARVRRQMNRLAKDAHTKGKGGWDRHNRGVRYQQLAGALSGKGCSTHLHWVSPNQVRGGTPRQRLVAAARRAAANSAAGRRHSFYSQGGYWTVKHGITGEPSGARSDCSQWVTSIYWTAGLADPNGAGYSGGFTGTLLSHGRAINRRDVKPGDLVIYGYGNGHHVEMIVDYHGNTIGHGSAPVDAGYIDMMGGYKRYRRYVK